MTIKVTDIKAPNGTEDNFVAIFQAVINLLHHTEICMIEFVFPHVGTLRQFWV